MRPTLLSLLAAAPAIVCVAPALAQGATGMRELEPRWAVVTQDGAALRAGDMDRFYKIDELEEGDLVRIDAQSDRWARVVYPPTQTAFVPAAVAEPAGETLVRLTVDDRLRAANMHIGIGGSWALVYEEPLPAGTVLRLRETLFNERGDVIGYRVLPPSAEEAGRPAYGYVRLAQLRDATEPEIAAYLARIDPARAGSAEPDAASPSAPSQGEPAARPPAQQPPAGVDTSLLESPRPPRPGDRPTQPPAVEPAERPEAAPAGQPAAIEQGQPRAPQAPAQEAEPAPEETPALDLEGLEAEFASARRLPPEQLDEALDELRAEFVRAREQSDDPGVQRYADQRIAWIDLRIETRDSRRRLEQTLAQADERLAALSARVDQIRRQQDYRIVGRLVPSTVYDGERLPLMYRIQSVGGPEGVRTLGYLRPGPGVELQDKIGEVVGVRGRTFFDDALRAVIVDPTDVDVLSPAG